MVCSLYTLSRFIFVSLLEKQHMFKRTASSVVDQHRVKQTAQTRCPSTHHVYTRRDRI
jgi:hypothetical protein